jgi:prepilin-type N-terminal cleavage/methylation domain-containing protein
MNRHSGERGFSLIEVLLALGLLAAVLISTTWLLVIGSYQAKSGRTASEALSVAGTILEEMQGWGFRQTYLAYGLDGTATSYTIDTRSNSYASKWQSTLNSKLHNSYAIVELESLDSSGTPPPLAGTQTIGVTVRVFWVEGDRSRNIRVRTVRM